MIRVRDVIRSKVPYPIVSSELAQITHMYICKNSGRTKELIKIQSVKTKHKINGFPTSNYFLFSAEKNNNPFRKDSFADLEKNFLLKDVKIPMNLATSPNIDYNDYTDMISCITNMSNISINTDDFLELNKACSRI